MIMIVTVVSLLLFGFVEFPAAFAQAKECGLRLGVVDMLGVPLEGAEIRLSSVGMRPSKRIKTPGYAVNGIPCGTYIVTASLPGLFGRREVSISQPAQWVPLGMEVGWHGPDRIDVSGKVTSATFTSGGDLWIKYTSLFSDSVKEAKVDKTGVFYLNAVPEGLGLLVVIRDQTVCDARVVTFTAAQSAPLIELQKRECN